MSDTPLSHVGSSGARLADGVRSESMGPIRHVRPFGRPCIAPLAMGITGRTTTQPLRLKKFLVENAPGARGRLRHG